VSRRRLHTAALSTLGLLVALPALASPAYPEALQSDTGAPCAPPCTVCHRDANGGFGTVVTPFGKAMIAAGLVAADTDSLKAALKDLQTNQTDSDGDGTPDVEELSAGTDPNVAGGQPFCGPTYGCGAHVEPGGHADGWAALVALIALGMLALGTRRNRRR
jgi:MYXO-CTERM domain-containing protein